MIPALVLMVLIHEFLTTPVYSEREVSAMREKAVALSKAGEVDSAIERLRALSEVAPDNRGAWGDYLTVLTRAGRSPEAIALFKANPKRALPDYALSELFDAAIAQRDFDSARALAAREVAQSKKADDIKAERARALSKAEAPPEPIETAAPASEPAPASGPAAAPASTPPAAAPGAERFRRVIPRPIVPPRVVPAGQPTALTHAAAVMPKTPISAQRSFTEAAPAPTEATSVPTLAEQARQAVRNAEQAQPGDRVAQALMALPVLDRYENSLLTGKQPAGVDLRNEKLDRVRALTLANRLDEAAMRFDALDKSETLPFYGVLNGADLYSRRHEPGRAAALLDRAEQMAPNSRQVLVARFYNQLDREQYGAADETIKRLQIVSFSSAEQRETKLLAAMFDAYRNRLQPAQVALESLRDSDPSDTGTRLRLAQIYRWRGWPQRALTEYRAVQPALADPVSAQVGAIAAEVDMNRFAQARTELSALAAAQPGHPDVMQAQADQRVRNLSAYSAQIMAGQSSQNPVTGSGDLAIEQRLYSAPIADQYRVFAHQRYDAAHLPEGYGSADRIGLGADYRSQYVDASVELRDRMAGAHFGATVNGEWRPNDYLSVFGEVQTDSASIPLRALHAGIDGESYTVGVRYRADESHVARANYSRTNFSDGNERDAVSASYRQALYQGARHQIVATLQAYYAKNSAGTDVPYYNPDQESSLGATVEYSGVINRTYEHSWTQRVAVGAGSYSQQHIGNSGIWDVEYEQRWQFRQGFGMNYGALYRSRTYDGNREGYGAIFAGVNWRF